MNIHWNNVTSDNRNAIVFEGRNQKYGAFKIRTTYNRTLTLVLAGMVGFSASVFGVKTFLDKNVVITEEVKHEYDSTIVTLQPPTEEDIPKVDPPAAPEAPDVTTTSFSPPTIDDDADDNTRTQDDVANVTVGTTDHIGDSTGVERPIIDEGPGGNGFTAPVGPEVFTIVEEMPEFIGGNAAMAKFIQTNVQFPTIAREAGISGKCHLKFIVGGDGQIGDVEVLKGVPGCPECDKEAIRIVKAMPTWKGGKQNGRPVNVYYNLPINFKVQ
jgi:periplasmic protein TonB